MHNFVVTQLRYIKTVKPPAGIETCWSFECFNVMELCKWGFPLPPRLFRINTVKAECWLREPRVKREFFLRSSQ